MKLAVGVIGGHDVTCHDQTWAALAGLGRAIAERDCTLITGTCPGLPSAVVLGAKAAGGLVVGISPALARSDHLFRHGCPTEGYDVLIYTGAGAAGRDALVVRSADIVVTTGDGASALDQVREALADGRLIGVLTGLGRAAPAPPDPARWCDEATGAVVLSDNHPVTLIGRLIAYYQAEHASHPNRFCRAPAPAVPSGLAAAPAG